MKKEKDNFATAVASSANNIDLLNERDG